MADYATLDDLKNELGISDTTDDTRLATALGSASLWIEERTGWRFYTTTTAETRYYTATSSRYVDIPDGLLTLTTLATDDDMDRTYEVTWATTDYDLTPDNAALDGKPYTRIEIAPLGRYGFPRHRKGVAITAKFGYCSTTPDAIKRLCLLAGQQIFMYKDMPFGVMSASAVGTLMMKTPEHPFIESVLAAYKRSID